jgi:hypothetical protein
MWRFSNFRTACTRGKRFQIATSRCIGHALATSCSSGSVANVAAASATFWREILRNPPYVIAARYLKPHRSSSSSPARHSDLFTRPSIHRSLPFHM